MFSSNQQKLFRCLHNYQVVHHKFIRHEKCLDVDRATTHFFVLSQPESIFLNWRFSAALRSHDFFLSFALLFIHKISDIQHLNFYVIFINNNFRLEAIKLRQWIMELNISGKTNGNKNVCLHIIPDMTCINLTDFILYFLLISFSLISPNLKNAFVSFWDHVKVSSLSHRSHALK